MFNLHPEELRVFLCRLTGGGGGGDNNRLLFSQLFSGHLCGGQGCDEGDKVVIGGSQSSLPYTWENPGAGTPSNFPFKGLVALSETLHITCIDEHFGSQLLLFLLLSNYSTKMNP